MGNGAVFLALSSVCIMLLYIAYLMVTVPLLVAPPARAGCGASTSAGPVLARPLGRAGQRRRHRVGQAGMAVNLAWPRAAIYDPAGKTWWLQWSAPLFILLVLLVGAVVHWRNRARHGGAIVLGTLHTSAEPVEATAS